MSINSITFKLINRKDIKAAEGLLQDNGLPLAGFPDNTPVILGAYRDKRLIGCSALEIHGSYGLLRSLVVIADKRNTGIGKQLVESILEIAAQKELISIFLLTETAANYFPLWGFQKIERTDVPDIVRNSIEFTSACPSTATAMKLQLDQTE